MRRKRQRPNSQFIERLLPVASRLLRQCGDSGTTVSDLREVALKLGVLTGVETAKQLSSLGQVFRRLGAVGHGTRRSGIAVTHGIRQTVWYPPVHESPYLD